MDFTIEVPLAHPPAAVQDALLDPDFIHSTADLPKLGGAEVLECTRNDQTARVRVRYKFTAPLSRVVTSVIDPGNLTWVDDATFDLASCTSEHMGLIGLLMTPMLTGFDLAIAAPQDFLAAPGDWMRWVSDFRGTITCGPNFAYALAARAMRRLGDIDLSAWRLALNGAEPIDPASVELFCDAGAPYGLDGKSPFCVYGMRSPSASAWARPSSERSIPGARPESNGPVCAVTAWRTSTRCVDMGGGAAVVMRRSYRGLLCVK